uniref:DUF2769 domain-containing protein n=1 Tax=Rhabditophanes sp. KR3021 TaxID=114890 RepID=A0AC35TUS1_9BILA
MFSLKFLSLVLVVVSASFVHGSESEETDEGVEAISERFNATLEDFEAYRSERDFTEACDKIANTGADYCTTFNMCCSPVMMLNPFGADKCQEADQENLCIKGGDGVIVKICRARKCSMSEPTTTTTTEAPENRHSYANGVSTLTVGK